MEPVSKSLSGPSRHPLHVCGQFTGILSHRTEEVEEEIFVVQGLQMSLLGRPAIKALGLVTRVNAIESQENLIAKYLEEWLTPQKAGFAKTPS